MPLLLVQADLVAAVISDDQVRERSDGERQEKQGSETYDWRLRKNHSAEYSRNYRQTNYGIVHCRPKQTQNAHDFVGEQTNVQEKRLAGRQAE